MFSEGRKAVKMDESNYSSICVLNTLYLIELSTHPEGWLSCPLNDQRTS